MVRIPIAGAVHRGSKWVVGTSVRGDGRQVLVEAGKDDEAAAEETAGDFGHPGGMVSLYRNRDQKGVLFLIRKRKTATLTTRAYFETSRS